MLYQVFELVHTISVSSESPCVWKTGSVIGTAADSGQIWYRITRDMSVTCHVKQTSGPSHWVYQSITSFMWLFTVNKRNNIENVVVCYFQDKPARERFLFELDLCYVHNLLRNRPVAPFFSCIVNGSVVGWATKPHVVRSRVRVPMRWIFQLT
jgi:hypothetical protein